LIYNGEKNFIREEKILKIGEIVKDYRNKNKISQRQFAQRCRVSNGYISMLEEGKNPKTNEQIIPTLETYKKIAYGMGISLNMLFSLMDDAPITVNKSPSAEPELTEGEREFLKLFRMLPEQEQRLYIEMLRARLNARTKGQAQS
jgi:transcriptional regulator with XRE-family HTH domain